MRKRRVGVALPVPTPAIRFRDIAAAFFNITTKPKNASDSAADNHTAPYEKRSDPQAGLTRKEKRGTSLLSWIRARQRIDSALIK
jgi:hypothetical protein